jgi:hypothetical protein
MSPDLAGLPQGNPAIFYPATTKRLIGAQAGKILDQL